MKGRRKVKTEKWKAIEQLIQEARATLESSPRAQFQGRFLAKAEAAGRYYEPEGILAGSAECNRKTVTEPD